MAIAEIVGGIWVGLEPGRGGGITLTSLLIDASGEKIAYVFYCPKAGTLDTGEFCVFGAVGSAQDLKVSWQDVGTDDLPDGVVDQWSVVPAASVTINAWIAPPLMTNDGTPTGVKRVVTLGQRLALVIEFNNVIGSVSLRAITGTALNGNNSYHRVGGVWVRSSVKYPDMTVKYDDSYVAPFNCWPVCQGAASGPALSTNTTPDEIGLKFTVPMSCTLEGVTWAGQVSATGISNYDLVLYDAANTVLASTSQDVTVTAHWATDLEMYVPFTSAVVLAPNTVYRVVVKPTTATALPRFGYFVQLTAAIAAFVVGGATWTWTERTDGGAWTDSKTGSDSTLQCHPHMTLHLAAAEAVAVTGGIDSDVDESAMIVTPDVAATVANNNTGGLPGPGVDNPIVSAPAATWKLQELAVKIHVEEEA